MSPFLAIILFISMTNVYVFHAKDTEFKCKSNKNVDFVDIERFTDNMCAQCFWYMAGVENAWKRFRVVSNWYIMYNHSDYINVVLCRPECTQFKYRYLNKNDYKNDPILREFKNDFHMKLFLKCCEDARNCCQKMLQLNENDNDLISTGKRCATKWDGWMCWDSVDSGQTSYKICPDMSHSVLGYMPTECSKEYASKHCNTNGSWAQIWALNNQSDPSSIYHQEYTNYMKCSTPGATERLRETHTAIAIYFVSFIFCSIGSIIFIIYRQYKIFRVQIHLNFLSSLILTSIFSILFYYFVREKHYMLESMIDENPLWCKALVVLHKGARLANFCWMLNEGIYLHLLIVAAFREQRRKIYYYLFGWGAPVAIMVPYIIVHSIHQYDNSCWTKSMLYPELLYNVLPLLTIVFNAVLLANVVRVLMTKLRASPDHFKAGLRASIVLLPIFGIQYIFYVVPIDPFNSCGTVVFVARYLQIVIEALQGTIVTTIFCFLNGEVHSHIRKSIRKRFPKTQELVVTEEQELEKTT